MEVSRARLSVRSRRPLSLCFSLSLSPPPLSLSLFPLSVSPSFSPLRKYLRIQDQGLRERRSISMLTYCTSNNVDQSAIRSIMPEIAPGDSRVTCRFWKNPAFSSVATKNVRKEWGIRVSREAMNLDKAQSRVFTWSVC